MVSDGGALFHRTWRLLHEGEKHNQAERLEAAELDEEGTGDGEADVRGSTKRILRMRR